MINYTDNEVLQMEQSSIHSKQQKLESRIKALEEEVETHRKVLIQCLALFDVSFTGKSDALRVD